MKKLISCLMGFVFMLTAAVTPVMSTDVIQEKPLKIVITGFYNDDLIDFMKATKDSKKGDTVTIYTIGPGGNAFICLGIVNHIKELKRKGVKIVTVCGTMAASANGVIWMLGDERVARDTDMLMLHYAYPKDPYGKKIEIKTLPKEAQFVFNTINSTLRQLLLDIVRDTEIVNEMLNNDENWYTGEDLHKLGLVTELLTD